MRALYTPAQVDTRVTNRFGGRDQYQHWMVHRDHSNVGGQRGNSKHNVLKLRDKFIAEVKGEIQPRSVLKHMHRPGMRKKG